MHCKKKKKKNGHFGIAVVPRVKSLEVCRKISHFIVYAKINLFTLIFNFNFL